MLFFFSFVCLCFFFFFFQAEDGIRDIGVTGVQTCALPISSIWGVALLCTMLFLEIPPRVFSTGTSFFSTPSFRPSPLLNAAFETNTTDEAVNALPKAANIRSEERRVGKECRSRGSPYHEKR